MANSDELALAADFPAGSDDQWRALVDKVLKGGDFDKKLVSRTYDGIEIQPLYTSASLAARGGVEAALPGSGMFTRGSTEAGTGEEVWQIRQAQAHPDPTLANAQIIEELEGGANSIALCLDLGTSGRGDSSQGSSSRGIVVRGVDDLAVTLEGVFLDLVSVVLEAGADFGQGATLLSALWDRSGIAADVRSGSFGADPIGVLAQTGLLPQGLDAAMADVVSLSESTVAWPKVRAIEVDTAAYVDAGATEVEELAVMLATGVAYLRALTDSERLSVTDAAQQIGFTLSADTDVFATIAKIRAARRLWSHVLAAAGVTGPSAATPLSARTSTRIMAQRDPWTNMLRTTAACFAAGVAGATAVTVQPFDAALGLPDDLARRIARNTQLILQEEAHIAEVLDPAGGSYFVESLTNEFTERAWQRFQQIEAAGGMVAVLVDGSEAATLATQSASRLASIARRKDPLTGVSEFPDIAETLLERAPAVRRTADAGMPDSSASATTIAPLGSVRLASQFEGLRDASDASLASDGRRPQVFLANLGPVAVHTARATFAKNFFEAGGVEAVGTEGYDDEAELIAAFNASGARVAVICSSDAIYAERAAAAAIALRACGCDCIYLAGNPGDRRDELTSAGITGFIHVGVNVIETLVSVHQFLGVAA